MEPIQAFGSLSEYNFVPSKRGSIGKYSGDIMKGKRKDRKYFLKTRKAKRNETTQKVKAELMECRHPSILSVCLLFERIRNVSFARRLAWLVQIAEGFQFLHKKKKVVKTFTLVIQDMTAKIADLDTIGWENSMLLKQFNESHAPEALSKNQMEPTLAFTKETNIWSLGMSFLSALFHSKDGRSFTPEEILEATKSKQDISLQYIQFTDLRDLLVQMMDVAKESRPNIEEVCRRLKQLQDWEIRVLSIEPPKIVENDQKKSIDICRRHQGGDQVVFKILNNKSQKHYVEEFLYRQKFNHKTNPQTRKGLQHIVDIQGAYCKKNTLLFQTKIVMEKCQKGILEFIDEFTSFSCIIDLMLEITEGLCFLQEKFKVAHLDVKPENILIKNGKVKIIDFDISKIMSDSWSQQSYKFGTKGYTAPEIRQVGFSGHGFSTDVWSLGITFAHILQYQGISDNWPEQPGDEEQFPSTQNLEVIKKVQMRNLIGKMLVRNPKKRIVMREVQKELRDIRSKISKNSEGQVRNISQYLQKVKGGQEIKVFLVQQLDNFQAIFRQIYLQQAKNSLNQLRMSNDLPQQQAKNYSKVITLLLNIHYPNQPSPTILQSFITNPKQIYSLEQFINKILDKITSIQLTLAEPIAHDDPAMRFADLVQPYAPAFNDYLYNQTTNNFQFNPTQTADSSYINNTVILAAMPTAKIKQIKTLDTFELKNYLMALARRKKVIDNLKRQRNRGAK